MTYVLFGLAMAFLWSLAAAFGSVRHLFSQNSTTGCLIATALVMFGIYYAAAHPSLQDARLFAAVDKPEVETEEAPAQVVRARHVVPSRVDAQPEALAVVLPQITEDDRQVETAAASSNRFRTDSDPLQIVAFSAMVPPARDTSPAAYKQVIQTMVLNSEFEAAKQELDDMLARHDVPTDAYFDLIEKQALQRIRPIPMQNRQANLEGYQFLAALRPDNETYQAKVLRYSQ